MLKQQHQLFSGLFAAADAAVITLACFAAWLIRRTMIEHGWWPEHLVEYPKEALVIIVVPIVIVALRSFGLYRPRRDSSIFAETYQIIKACATAMPVVLAALYVLDVSVFRLDLPPATLLGITLDAGRLQLAALTLILPVALTLHRLTLRTALRMLRRRGWNLRHVAIIGTGRLGQIVAQTLDRNSWTGLKAGYFIEHHDRARRDSCMNRPVFGGLSDLENVLLQHKPDAVYVAIPAKQSAAIPALLARLEKFPVDVRIVPDVNPRYVPQSMTVGELDGMPVLSYRESPITGFGGVNKRVLDIAGALLALVIFAPVMLLVAFAVRLSGPGPVVFKQRRVSLGGQVFDLYKFRTMHHARDEGYQTKCKSPGTGEWTVRNDPRVTRVGHWLRRTSLDELPQLWNVLIGEMSLVGPRPERPELIERFREDWRGYILRQHVKAGMTGWAQVNGHRGNSSLRKRLQYDLFYVKNWSLAFDMKILVLTLVRGFVHRNAY